MIKITYDDVLRIHDQGIEMYGGSFGLRDSSRIESAIESIYQTFFGVELYPDITDKASFLACALVNGHPFIDGNKRMGMAVMLTFLNLNGYELELTDQELIDLGLDIAQSKKDKEEVKSWIIAHKKQNEKSNETNVTPKELGEE